jgi:hypothetical protein
MRSSRVVAGAVVAVACVLAWSPAWAQNEEAERKAEEAAKTWLTLVDAGKNVESYYATTTWFRYTVAKEKWDARLVNARRPLGNVKSRTLSQKKYTTDLPDVPKGVYVVIVFKTVFENMPKNVRAATETITPMLQKDGSWRVAGYNVNLTGK